MAILLEGHYQFWCRTAKNELGHLQYCCLLFLDQSCQRFFYFIGHFKDRFFAVNSFLRSWFFSSSLPSFRCLVNLFFVLCYIRTKAFNFLNFLLSVVWDSIPQPLMCEGSVFSAICKLPLSFLVFFPGVKNWVFRFWIVTFSF